MNLTFSGEFKVAGVLMVIAALIVVGGGFAFYHSARTPFGSALGLVHLTLGLVLLAVALALFGGTRWIRDLAILWSGVVVAYSCTTEAVVFADKLLPPGADLGSLGGTIVAVGLLVSSVALVVAAGP